VKLLLGTEGQKSLKDRGSVVLFVSTGLSLLSAWVESVRRSRRIDMAAFSDFLSSCATVCEPRYEIRGGEFQSNRSEDDRVVKGIGLLLILSPTSPICSACPYEAAAQYLAVSTHGFLRRLKLFIFPLRSWLHAQLLSVGCTTGLLRHSHAGTMRKPFSLAFNIRPYSPGFYTRCWAI
jgi:hypothetical protein